MWKGRTVYSGHQVGRIRLHQRFPQPETFFTDLPMCPSHGSLYLPIVSPPLPKCKGYLCLYLFLVPAGHLTLNSFFKGVLNVFHYYPCQFFAYDKLYPFHSHLLPDNYTPIRETDPKDPMSILKHFLLKQFQYSLSSLLKQFQLKSFLDSKSNCLYKLIQSSQDLKSHQLKLFLLKFLHLDNPAHILKQFLLKSFLDKMSPPRILSSYWEQSIPRKQLVCPWGYHFWSNSFWSSSYWSNSYWSNSHPIWFATHQRSSQSNGFNIQPPWSDVSSPRAILWAWPSMWFILFLKLIHMYLHIPKQYKTFLDWGSISFESQCTAGSIMAPTLFPINGQQTLPITHKTPSLRAFWLSLHKQIFANL